MPFNTSIHWHGLSLPGTPWSDGMPGLSQKPIEPGQSYVYNFKATPSGTYWYHSHSRMDILDGLYGAIFIRPKPESPTPFHLIPGLPKSEIRAMRAAANDPTMLVLSEWTNYTSWDYMKAQEDSELDIFCMDSLLINGKGSLFCPPIEELFAVTPPNIANVILPGYVNDKGCLPFVNITEGPFLPGKPETIPPGLESGCQPAEGGMPYFKVNQHARSGWVSINFIMASTLRIGKVSVDNHDMWLYEIDGQFIEPRLAKVVFIYPGQRIAAMVKLNQPAGDYTIRFADDGSSQIVSGYAVLSYRGTHTLKNYTLGYQRPTKQKEGYINYGGILMDNSTAPFQLDTIDHFPPYPNVKPATPQLEGDEMYLLEMGRFGAAWKWTMNGKTLYPVDMLAYHPLLYEPNSKGVDDSLIIRTKNGSWVDIILAVGALPGEPVEIYHAIHKHGNKFHVMGHGYGKWNYSSVAEAVLHQPHLFNLENPNIRDTAMTNFTFNLGAEWVAIRYHSINPGCWLLHCHLETHLAGGMGVVIMDGVDAWPEIPPEYQLNGTAIANDTSTS
ncbi:hypothetical protein JDV02_010038 [Purpureocillium takamizusanense]|uniref:Multicopper oxidase n=1 Tax=Purpureocillium takamizusanense TaxID=2060973 RepID=A0A9Q8QN75_9HYPO|nr:uncharacterized protein JDV02_010038 [Purpureocillium takamizusanense]UNI24279.1 hypothetical protein JDV02_010038 [Purpureocillium takamizusanense]